MCYKRTWQIQLQTHLALYCGDNTQRFVACTGESEVSVVHRKDISKMKWLCNLFTVFVSLRRFTKFTLKTNFLEGKL